MLRTAAIIAGTTLAISWAAFPAVAAHFHPMVIRPAASPTTRSSASVLTNRANARASYAAGNPYVNPNVGAGGRTTQTNASANANAAEMRSAHESITRP